MIQCSSVSVSAKLTTNTMQVMGKLKVSNMKKNKYRVWFSNVNYAPQCVLVSAFNRGSALILAQAERIKEGSDYTLFKIEEVN